MSFLLSKFLGTIVRYEWSAGNSGPAASGGTTQFLYVAASVATPTTVETNGQLRAATAFRIWRLTSGFTRGTPTSQATVTARINGVGQGSTVTVIGTALGIIVTDLASPISVLNTDQLALSFVTTTTDTGTTHPVGQLVGELLDSF